MTSHNWPTEPNSSLADSTEKYLIPRYQKETVNLESSGGFTTGFSVSADADIQCVRIGDIVVITSKGRIKHGNTDTVSSAAGFIPAAYRPNYNAIAVCYFSDAGTLYRACSVQISAAGTITTYYSQLATDTFFPLNITYNLT